MLNNILLAVPSGMEELWYIYDLMLLFIIAVLVLILMLFRRKSNLKEAQNNLRYAMNSLRKAVGSKATTKTRLRLFTAKNLLSSSVFAFKRCVDEEDMYSLGAKIGCILSTIETLDMLIKDSSEQDISAKVLKLINDIERC